MTSVAPIDIVRRLRVPGYFILGIALALPLLDFFLSVLPVRADTVAWRFGTIGLFASALTVPLLVMFFIYALALMVEDRKVVILVGIVALLVGIVALGSSAAFALDALQMKARVQPQAYTRFRTASIQAMTKLVVEGIAGIVLAVSIFRTIRTLKMTGRSPKRSPTDAFLMGRPVAPRSESASTSAES